MVFLHHRIKKYLPLLFPIFLCTIFLSNCVMAELNKNKLLPDIQNIRKLKPEEEAENKKIQQLYNRKIALLTLIDMENSSAKISSKVGEPTKLNKNTFCSTVFTKVCTRYDLSFDVFHKFPSVSFL